MIYTILNLSTLTSAAFLAFIQAIAYVLMLVDILNSLYTLTPPDTLVFIMMFASFIIGVKFIVKRMQVAASTQRPQYDPLQAYYTALENIDHADNENYSLGHIYNDSLTLTINKLGYTTRTSSVDLTTPPKQPFERLTTVLRYEQLTHANLTDPCYIEVTSAVTNVRDCSDKTGLPITDVDPFIPQCTLHRSLSPPPSPSDSDKANHVGNHDAIRLVPSYERPAMGLGPLNMDPNMQVAELATNNNTNQVDDDGEDYYPDPEDD